MIEPKQEKRNCPAHGDYLYPRWARCELCPVPSISIFEKIHTRRNKFIREQRREPKYLVLSFGSWCGLLLESRAGNRIQIENASGGSSYYGMLIAILEASGQAQEYIEIA